MNIKAFPFLMVLIILIGSIGWAEDQTSIVEPGAKVMKLAGGMQFTEGPVWLPKEKKLIFSDIPNSKLMQWSEKGGLSVYRQSEKANGNILDLQGRIISCQHDGRNVIRIETDGSTTVLADTFEGKRFNSPNDAAVMSDGTLWFTDPPWGLEGSGEIPGHWVYKLDPANSRVEPVIKDLAMPNGIVFSPDETRLYVADTGGDKRNPDEKTHDLVPGIHCFEVNTDGSLGKKLFKTDKGSDGMTVDVQGNVYTTQLDNRVLVIDADGKEVAEIDVPEAPANVCFGGKDYKTLFITARTSLYSVRAKYPGAKPKGVKWAKE
jgi:gluconolactonase